MILFFIGCSDPEPLDCAGVEGGDAIYDQCDICDGDGTSCTGCMELEACNYDLTAIVDDGSCWYSHLECECLDEIDAMPTGQMSSWKIRIGAEMLAYNSFLVKDISVVVFSLSISLVSIENLFYLSFLNILLFLIFLFNVFTPVVYRSYEYKS